jgi:hypothetical protein
METMQGDRPYITLICSDNTVDRNGGRFPATEIVKMPALIMGKPCTFDHDWHDVRSVYGRVAGAYAYETTPPENLDEDSLAAIALEGYWVCEIAVEVSRAEQSLPVCSENSIGFSYARMKCPDCTCYDQDMRSPKCPSSPWDMAFWERCDLVEVFEDSFVLIPANPHARRIN